MNRDFYEKLISEIEEAIKAGDYKKADRLISAELAMPYVPAEVLATLQKHKQEIAPNLRVQKPVTLIEPEQLESTLEKGGEEAAGALRSLQKANIRNYLTEINECLKSSRIDHLIKVLLSEMLVEQKVDQTFEFRKGNETLIINPSEMVTVSQQPQLLKVMETLEKLLPAAEKLGMVIAVENAFEMPNSAKEVMGLVDHFGGDPAIGVCYDTGHAHCMESAPGKDNNKYEPYFPKCWWENGVIWEDHALEITCHIHDNNGYGDLHGMPFDGNINWRDLMPRLTSCPRMIDFQTEICFKDGENWSGRLLAPPGGYSIRRLTDTFRYLGF